MTCYKYSITCQDDLLTVDNAQSHVTAFRPISEAARSWPDDNECCEGCDSFIPPLDPKENLPILRGTDFMAKCLSFMQPTMPEHYRKLKALTLTWPHRLFIDHWAPEGRSVGPFILALCRQCHSVNH